MNEWQPIETVPKDGTKVLVFMPNYERSKTKIEFAEYRPNISIIANLFSFDFKEDQLPTHWMHLPNHPSKTQE